MPKKNFSKIKKEDDLIIWKESPFNSKLFFDLNTSLNNVDTSGSDNSYDSNELEIKNNKNYFLLNDLIKEMDSSLYEQEENPNKYINNFNNSQFQNYIYNQPNYIMNRNIFYPYGYIPLFEKNIIRGKNSNRFIMKTRSLNEKKDDWICFFCHNLNFSFRTKCNRCKASKNESIKREKEF